MALQGKSFAERAKTCRFNAASAALRNNQVWVVPQLGDAVPGVECEV